MTDWEGLSPPYATIVVDPPWHYEGTSPPIPASTDPNAQPSWRVNRAGKPGLGYSSLSLDEIKALPIGDLTEDGRVFLWTTNRYLFDARDVLRAWGFDPGGKVYVWCKTPRGTATITTEFFLAGKRGNPPRLPWGGTTWFDWPLQGGGATLKGSHSRKPAAFFDLVEAWSPGPYVELFARNPRLGWDHWGHGYELALSAEAGDTDG
jgi:N6-adenosine-specific RNA methylase IME4